MTDQELADTIRKRFPDVDAWIMPMDLIQFLKEHPPAVPEPPCTIDQVPGWTVHTDANGRMFAMDANFGHYGAVYQRDASPSGVPVGSDKEVHPWPDPPRYQPGDPVDVYPAEISVTTSKWTHQGRTFIGLMPDGRVVVSLPDAANPVAWPPERVRPHVERKEGWQ